MSAITGNDVSMLCSSSGKPAPMLQWYGPPPNARAISSNENYAPVYSIDKEKAYLMLTIREADQKNAGIYTCIAWNYAGKEENLSELLVYC